MKRGLKQHKFFSLWYAWFGKVAKASSMKRGLKLSPEDRQLGHSQSHRRKSFLDEKRIETWRVSNVRGFGELGRKSFLDEKRIETHTLCQLSKPGFVNDFEFRISTQSLKFFEGFDKLPSAQLFDSFFLHRICLLEKEHPTL